MTRSASSLLPSPYRGLRPFTEDDADYFFGRQAEQEIVTANLLASRLTLLYGESGVGKTSLLRAGVVHQSRLLSIQDLNEERTPEQIAVYFNAWRDDPIAALTDCIGKAVREVLGPIYPPKPDEVEPVVQVVRTWSSLFHGELLIILDQFEEYFLYHPWEDGNGTFAVEFPRAVTCPDLRVGFLVSIREDALTRLDRFKGRIPNLFDNRLRVDHLSREGAQAAIEGPVEVYNQREGAGAPVTVDPNLVGALLEENRAGRLRTSGGGLGVTGERNRYSGDGRNGNGASGERTDGERIETAYLQVVLSRLWKEEMRQKSRVLRRDTLTRLGGAEKIVRTDLDEKLSGLSAPQQAIAATMLRHLVTPSGSKIALTTSDLAYFTKSTEAAVHPVLEQLSEVDVLRPVPSPRMSTTPSYEIGHDVLGPAILDWHRRYTQSQDERKSRLKLIAASFLALVLGTVALFVLGLQQRAERFARDASATADVTAAINSLPDDPERTLLLAIQAASETNHRGEPVRPEAQDALHQALHRSRLERTMAGHSAAVTSVAFSPDGIRLATASRDHTARIWDALSGKEIGTLRGHTAPVNAVAFSPDGSRLVTASRDSTARVWDAGADTSLLTLRGHRDVVYRATFSPDGNRIVTAGRDGTVKVWSATTGELLRTLLAHRAPVHGLAISPDGQQLATGSEDSTAAVWDLGSGKLLHRFTGHGDEVNGVAFSPDGRRLATASYDATARVWDIASGLTRLILAGHRSTVSSVAFSPDGGSLATGAWDRTVKLWDASTGRERLSLVGHGYTVGSIAFSPEGSRLASASGDGTAKVWNVAANPAEVIALSGERDFTSVAYSPDGSLLATASGDLVILWNKHFRRVWASPAYAGPVQRVAFSPDGGRLAAAGTDVVLWDMKAGGRPISLSGRIGAVRSIDFNRDGTRVATAGEDSVVRVWDGVTGDSLYARRTGAALYGVALNPDGRLVATVGEDHEATIWDLAGGKSVSLRGHQNRIRDVAFGPDGRWVVTGSDDQTARVWDAASGKPLRTLENHKGAVVSVTFDSAGDRIATASRDGSVKVWNASTGEELLTLPGPDGTGVRSVSFSPHGNRLAAAGEDSTVRVYALETGELMALARRRLTRSLTERECRRFLRAETCPATAATMKQVVAANMQARAGDLDSAAAGYAEANRRQVTLDIDPDREARLLRVETLAAEGEAMLARHDVPRSLAAFKQARELDAEAAADEVPGLLSHAQELAERGRILDALGIYRAAGDLDPNMRVSAQEWNNLCWYGSIWGPADSVLTPACETAVTLDSTSSEIRDSRGLARAVTGDPKGAVADFQVFVDSTANLEWKAERQGWIDSLRAGENPFTRARLRELLSE